jgi:A/G-specific adenine glycosylase
MREPRAVVVEQAVLGSRLPGNERTERASTQTESGRASTRGARKLTTHTDPAPSPAVLLAWYDRHRRVLPWRAKAGETPDPYRVWLSEIMLQQTTVRAVGPYFERFIARWPDVGSLAAAPLEDVLRLWAGLGYYARARNLHACAKALAARPDQQFPAIESELATLPGIGPYTAAAIAAIAFDTRAAAVDGNVERVVARLYAVARELPAAKPGIRALTQAMLPVKRCGDFAQALMDLGATICTPKKPACALCPWMEPCAARARGDAETFPRKVPKKEGRLRRGAAFVVRREDGLVLVRSRPPKGLLGGMTEVPTTDWTHDFDAAGALAAAPLLARAKTKWRRLPDVVTHVFTHFPLELTVYVTDAAAPAAAPPGMRWVALADVAGEALPSLMRKVLAYAGAWIEPMRKVR